MAKLLSLKHGLFLDFVLLILLAGGFVLPMSVQATNYFSWSVETPANNATTIGDPCNTGNSTYGVKQFWLSPWLDETTQDCTVAHSGSCSMKVVVVGVDGGNQGRGPDTCNSIAYPFNVMGSSGVYYRWWMKIQPGFSWGASDGKTKAARILLSGGELATVYVHGGGFRISECQNSVSTCDIPGGGTNNDYQGIDYPVSSMNDGLWHEYVLFVRPSSASGVADALFRAWVDGGEVSHSPWCSNASTHCATGTTGFRLYPTSQQAWMQAWGGAMAHPYFQMNGTALDGGTMYIDDVSTDNTYNSLLGGDTVAPTGVAVTVPSNGATVSGSQTVTASCTDETAVQGVQMLLDGSNLGSQDTTSPYSVTWDTTTTSNGSHTLSARCTDTSNNQTTSSTISVTVSNADVTAPVRSAGGPTGTLSYGTTSTTLTVTTDENATCKYATTAGIAYASLPNTFSTTGSTTHTQSLTGLTNGSSYTYYVRCRDAALNANTTDYNIAFSVAASGSVNECTNWQTNHPTWIWCDDFETDTSASWVDRNNPSTFLRSAGNGQGSSYSMRATYPATTGVANAGDFKIAFGASPVTPKINASDNTKYTELYWRAFIRTSANWLPGTGAKLTRATGFVNASWAQSFITHWWDSATAGILSVDPVSTVCRGGLKPDGITACTNNTVLATGWNDFTNFYWLGINNGTIPVLQNSHANIWQCLEGHTKLNASGVSDGVQELWIDGVLDAQKTGLNLAGTYSTYGINIFSVENYMNAGTGQSQYRDWDNLVLSTTRVGCTVGGSDTTPPAAPTGLTAE